MKAGSPPRSAPALHTCAISKFLDDSLCQHASGVIIGWVVPRDLDAVPAYQTSLGEDGVMLLRHQFCQDEREHHRFELLGQKQADTIGLSNYLPFEVGARPSKR